MAPIKPANTTPSEIASGMTTPLAMVDATAVPKIRKATKLKKAAHATAMRGDNTRVDTTVAIELAASWKPLTKSNASATPITATNAKFMMQAQACFRTIDSITFDTSSMVL